uniref:Uncharacterized protein n=1 Tax=viral metagenome TaxID=1070528 RepID=A0A6M3K7M9_9ZZZZ
MTQLSTNIQFQQSPIKEEMDRFAAENPDLMSGGTTIGVSPMKEEMDRFSRENPELRDVRPMVFGGESPMAGREAELGERPKQTQEYMDWLEKKWPSKFPGGQFVGSTLYETLTSWSGTARRFAGFAGVPGQAKQAQKYYEALQDMDRAYGIVSGAGPITRGAKAGTMSMADIMLGGGIAGKAAKSIGLGAQAVGRATTSGIMGTFAAKSYSDWFGDGKARGFSDADSHVMGAIGASIETIPSLAVGFATKRWGIEAGIAPLKQSIIDALSQNSAKGIQRALLVIKGGTKQFMHELPPEAFEEWTTSALGFAIHKYGLEDPELQGENWKKAFSEEIQITTVATVFALAGGTGFRTAFQDFVDNPSRTTRDKLKEFTPTLEKMGFKLDTEQGRRDAADAMAKYLPLIEEMSKKSGTLKKGVSERAASTAPLTKEDIEGAEIGAAKTEAQKRYGIEAETAEELVEKVNQIEQHLATAAERNNIPQDALREQAAIRQEVLQDVNDTMQQMVELLNVKNSAAIDEIIDSEEAFANASKKISTWAELAGRSPDAEQVLNDLKAWFLERRDAPTAPLSRENIDAAADGYVSFREATEEFDPEGAQTLYDRPQAAFRDRPEPLPGPAPQQVQTRPQGPQELQREAPADVLEASAGNVPQDELHRISRLKGIQNPELFWMASELMGVQPKLGSRMGVSRGMVKFGPTSGETQGRKVPAMFINPKTAANPLQLAYTLGHEIGHIVDWLPLGFIPRGNMGQKILKIHARMKDLHKDIAKMLQDMSREIKDELIELSEWWKPYEKEFAPASYVRERRSNAELFADAVSVMLNTPGELEARAPKFFHALTTAMDKHPEFKEAYLTLQEMVNGTPEELAAFRTEQIKDMFQAAKETWRWNYNEQRERREQLTESVGTYLWMTLNDRLNPARVRGRKLEAKGYRWKNGIKTEQLLDQFYMVKNISAAVTGKIQQDIVEPLLDAGVNLDAVGEYLFLRKVITIRGDKPSPRAFDPTTAAPQMDALRARLGDAAFAELENKMLQMHREIMLPLVQEAYENGLISDKVWKETVLPNVDNYAAFVVAHHLHSDKLSGNLMADEVGTFSDVINPLIGTMLKMTAIKTATMYNQLKARTIQDANALSEILGTPPEFRDAKLNKDGKPMVERMQGEELFKYMENGKVKAEWGPKALVDMFKTHDIGYLQTVGRFMNATLFYPFRLAWIIASPLFLAGNIFMDPARMFTNMPAVASKLRADAKRQMSSAGISAEEAGQQTKDMQITWGQIFGTLFSTESAKQAHARASGRLTPELLQMQSEGALQAPWSDLGKERDPDIILWENQFSKQGITVNEAKTTGAKFANALKRSLELTGVSTLYGGLKYAADWSETWTKYSGWSLMRKMSTTDVKTGKTSPVFKPEEIAWSINNYVGTPNYTKRGHATQLTDGILPLLNVRLNGLTADLKLATDKDSAYTWWTRFAVMSIPVVTSYMLKSGLLGDGALKEKFGAINEYVLKAYHVLPLCSGEDGKVDYISIPKAPTEALISSMVWSMVDWSKNRDEKGFNEITKTISDGFVPSVNPALDIAGKHAQWAMGINAYDGFDGRTIATDTQWKAGGWHRYTPVLNYTIDKFGTMTAAVRPFSDRMTGRRSRTISETAFKLTGIARLLRTADPNITPEMWDSINNLSQEEARFSLSLPQSARDLTLDRFKLSRLKKSGENLTTKQMHRLRELDHWYNRTYMPYTRNIRSAEKRKNVEQMERWRKELDRRSEKIAE